MENYLGIIRIPQFERFKNRNGVSVSLYSPILGIFVSYIRSVRGEIIKDNPEITGLPVLISDFKRVPRDSPWSIGLLNCVHRLYHLILYEKPVIIGLPVFENFQKYPIAPIWNILYTMQKTVFDSHYQEKS